MYRSMKSLHDNVMEGRDGPLGTVKDHLLDDHKWRVRYLVLDTGSWLPGRKVVVPPLALDPMKPGDFPSLSAPFTREQIEQSPPLDAKAPVSRQYQEMLNKHFAWKPFWSAPLPGEATGGLTTMPLTNLTAAEEAEMEPRPRTGDPHLRSAQEVTGYNIQATDGEIGHLEDFIFDGDTWRIKYFVVDTKNWLPGKKVLLPVEWIDAIHWQEQNLDVALTRDQIKDSPEFKPTDPVNETYEKALYDYYGRRTYRDEEVAMPAL